MPAGTVSYVGGGLDVAVTSGNIVLAPVGGSPPSPGDLLIAAIAYRSNAAFTAPDGSWTKQEEENLGDVGTLSGIASLVVFWKIATASEPASYTFTRTGGSRADGSVYVFRGNVQSSPIDGSSSATLGAATFTATSPSLTTTLANDMLFMVMAAATNNSWSNEAAATDPLAAGWNEFSDNGDGDNTVASVRQGMALARKATAGATGQFSADCTVSRRNAMAVLAIKAAPSVVVAPSVDSIGLATVAPIVKLGSLVFEKQAVFKFATVNPTVLTGPVVVAPAPAAFSLSGGDPVVGTSSVAVAPAPAVFKLEALPPEVKGELLVSPAAAAMSMIVVNPTVVITFGPTFAPEASAFSAWGAQAPSVSSWSSQSAPSSNPWTSEGSL